MELAVSPWLKKRPGEGRTKKPGSRKAPSREQVAKGTLALMRAMGSKPTTPPKTDT